MSLNTFVYIRDVNNLSDARFCAGMGVDLLGFRLDPSREESLDANSFREISEWIAGVKLVGEFGNLTVGQIDQIIADIHVDMILVPGLKMLDEYLTLNIPLILNLDIDQITDTVLAELNYRTGTFTYILLTGKKEKISDKEKKLVSDLSALHPVLLGFGFNQLNAGELVTELGTEGISMVGSSEIRPGYKDYDELAEILESLESD